MQINKLFLLEVHCYYLVFTKHYIFSEHFIGMN